MSKDSKQTSTSSTLQLPKAPSYITDSLEGLTGAVMNLGSTDPNQYVAPQSGLQSQAFGMGSNIASRYGGTTATQSAQPDPNSFNASRQQGGGQSLFDGLGVSQPNTTNYDWQAIANDRPDIQAAFNSLTPQQHADIAQVTGNPDGVVNVSDFARYQIEANGPNAEYEQRMQELSGIGAKGTDPRPSGMGWSAGAGQSAPIDMGGGRFGSSPSSALQAQPAQPGQSQGLNPLDLYGQAAAGTTAAGLAGANLADGSDIFSMLLNNEAGPSVTAGNVSAQSLLDNLQSYMSPYTNDVVDTTLAGYDEEAARTRAQQAATAAGSGANRGTRNSIFEAVLEGEIGRERANTEATLRDTAFNTGAALSGQDADRRQSASASNAELRQQASQANAQMELERMMSAANMMYGQNEFNANQMDESLARTLSASGQLADIGSTYQQNERADTGLLAELGAQEREIDGQQRTADLGLLQTILNMTGGLGINTSQVTGVANNTNQTTTSTPGLLDWYSAYQGA